MSSSLSYNIWGLLSSAAFLISLFAGLMSGCFAVGLMYADANDYISLDNYNPNTVVFNVFIVFASLMAAARTSHALVRYIDAASLMHRQSSFWYDAAATLVAFSRNSTAPKEKVRAFQELSVRLFSLLCAFCLEGLSETDLTGDLTSAHEFNIIGWEDMAEWMQDNIMEATDKAEYVMQQIDHLIVDAVHSGVIQIAPPLLTRSFQEMGQALATYHEAKKFSRERLPYAYMIITRCILVTTALFVPFILAENTAGYTSAFLCTFGGTFMMWFMNGVAENLDNPFKKCSNNLDVPEVQQDFNRTLLQLLKSAEEPTPALSDFFIEKINSRDAPIVHCGTVHGIKRSHSRRFTDKECKRDSSDLSSAIAAMEASTDLPASSVGEEGGEASDAQEAKIAEPDECRQSFSSSPDTATCIAQPTPAPPEQLQEKPLLGEAGSSNTEDSTRSGDTRERQTQKKYPPPPSSSRPQRFHIGKKDDAASKHSDPLQAREQGAVVSVEDDQAFSREQLPKSDWASSNRGAVALGAAGAPSAASSQRGSEPLCAV